MEKAVSAVDTAFFHYFYSFIHINHFLDELKSRFGTHELIFCVHEEEGKRQFFTVRFPLNQCAMCLVADEEKVLRFFQFLFCQLVFSFFRCIESFHDEAFCHSNIADDLKACQLHCILCHFYITSFSCLLSISLIEVYSSIIRDLCFFLLLLILQCYSVDRFEEWIIQKYRNTDLYDVQ